MTELIAVTMLAATVFGAGLLLASVTPRGWPAGTVGLLLAVGLIALITLQPTDSTFASVNLDPGAGLAAPWRSSTSAVNILGNLLLFVPLGVMLPAAVRLLRTPWLLVPAAAAVSTAVELTQYAYIPGRAADINDILLNTAGALAGLIALRVVRSASGRDPAYA